MTWETKTLFHLWGFSSSCIDGVVFCCWGVESLSSGSISPLHTITSFYLGQEQLRWIWRRYEGVSSHWWTEGVLVEDSDMNKRKEKNTVSHSEAILCALSSPSCSLITASISDNFYFTLWILNMRMTKKKAVKMSNEVMVVLNSIRPHHCVSHSWKVEDECFICVNNDLCFSPILKISVCVMVVLRLV